MGRPFQTPYNIAIGRLVLCKDPVLAAAESLLYRYCKSARFLHFAAIALIRNRFQTASVYCPSS
jgi:hypothetical protein